MSSAAHRITVNPVNSHSAVAMPAPWNQLADQGFHPDLLLRARAFMLHANREGHRESAVMTLWEIGNGFLVRFSSKRFQPKHSDPHAELKRNYLAALELLAEDFGSRVSSVVWDSLAFLGARDDPTTEKSVLSEKEYLESLGLNWSMTDTVLHALGKVYGLKHHVDSRIFATTGMLPDHNCDCNHAVQEPNGGSIYFVLPKERHEMATAALLSHLFTESVLIRHFKLPFELGISPEVAEILRAEGV